MAYLPKEITCESCLENTEFESGDVFQDGSSHFVTCHFCSNDIEIFDIEDFGINPRNVKRLKSTGTERDILDFGEEEDEEEEDW